MMAMFEIRIEVSYGVSVVVRVEIRIGDRLESGL